MRIHISPFVYPTPLYIGTYSISNVRLFPPRRLCVYTTDMYNAYTYIYIIHVSEAFYFMSVYTNDFELYPLNDIITVYETSAYILISRKRLVCIV